VNINPTNLIPRALAEDFWGGPNPDLLAFDLISPERASKNIGEFCVLMPGQEKIVLTRETLTLRSNTRACVQLGDSQISN
jgi:type I restriction enzyme M protein